MSDKNAQPQRSAKSSSRKRYFDRRMNGLDAANRIRRAKRHAKRMLRQQKRCNPTFKRVWPGDTRAARRKDISAFKREQRIRTGRLTGTIKVNAPSLEMLNKYIGSAAS